MKKFKSGDIVEIGNSRWMYACIHPIDKHDSMVIDPATYRTESFQTDELSLARKTNQVKGFEVPAPISEYEFKEAEATDIFYGFACGHPDGYWGITKSHTAITAVKSGLVFKTESDIKKNLAAMQGIDPNAVE